MVRQELIAIEQCPPDIFECELWLIDSLFEQFLCAFLFGLGRFSRDSGQKQMLNFLFCRKVTRSNPVQEPSFGAIGSPLHEGVIHQHP